MKCEKQNTKIRCFVPSSFRQKYSDVVKDGESLLLEKQKRSIPVPHHITIHHDPFENDFHSINCIDSYFHKIDFCLSYYQFKPKCCPNLKFRDYMLDIERCQTRMGSDDTYDYYRNIGIRMFLNTCRKDTFDFLD